MGQTNVWVDWFKLNNDQQNEIYIEDLMLMYISFQLSYARAGNSP